MQTQTRNNRWTALLAIVLFPLAACDDATGPAQAGLSGADMEAVAAFLASSEAFASGVSFNESVDGDGIAATTRTSTYTRTTTCPVAGQIEVNGSRTVSWDRDAGTASASFESTHAYQACEFERNEKSFKVDGSVVWAGSAAWQFQSDGKARQISEASGTRTGSITITSGDEVKTCDIALEKKYDPATNTFTVTGTMCGKDVNVTKTPGSREG